MKPFRLINDRQTEYISQQLLPVFKSWNALYTMKEITFSLEKSFEIPDTKALKKIHPIVQAEPSWLSFFNHCFFGEDLECFHAASEQIVQELWLMCMQATRPFQENPWTENWFYPGSSCLKMYLHSEDQQTALYLHPDWIYAQLPPPLSSKKALISLEQALFDESIALQARFKPFSIPLQALLSMESGDLLKTTHLLSEPLQLSHNQNILAEVQPCQLDDRKSILIKRYI